MNIFSRFKTSIMSYKGYLELIKESLPKAFLHLVILALISTAVIGTSFIVLYNSEIEIIKENLNLEENKFEYKNGEISFDKEKASFEEGEALMLMDTTISIDNYEELRKTIVHKDMAIAVVKDGIILRNMGAEQTIKFSDLIPIEVTLDNQSILDIIEEFDFIKYLTVVWVAITMFLSKLLFALIISVLGLVLNTLNKMKFKYKDIFKMSVYSLTLITLLEIILPVGSFTVLISGMYIVLVMNYKRRLDFIEKNKLQ